MGSIGNAIIYIINEGWESRELSFVSNQDENPINQSFNSNNNNVEMEIDNNDIDNINNNNNVNDKTIPVMMIIIA